MSNQNILAFGGQDIWAKMTSPGGKLTALACHLTKKVNKAEWLTYLSTNFGLGMLNLRALVNWHSHSNPMFANDAVRPDQQSVG
jgi:hypothetical protein